MIGAATSLLALVLSVVSYGVSASWLADSGRATVAQRRAWLLGVAAQGTGFLLALLARRSLPLLVVQPALTVSLAVTAVLGHRLGRSTLRRTDIVAIAVTCIGVAVLAVTAEPGTSDGVSGTLLLVVGSGLALVAVAAVRATGHLSLGALAGLCYSAVALLARPVAGALGSRSLPRMLVVAGVLLAVTAVLGQLLLVRALAGPRTMAPLATMFVVETVVPALAGMVLLGDGVRPGTGPVAAVGLALSAAGVLGLARAEAGAVPVMAPEPVRAAR